MKKLQNVLKVIGGISVITMLILLIPALWVNSDTRWVLGKVFLTCLILSFICYVLDEAIERMLKSSQENS